LLAPPVDSAALGVNILIGVPVAALVVLKTYTLINATQRWLFYA
jgi:hypothetical protein